jgi:hypothetical protein
VFGLCCSDRLRCLTTFAVLIAVILAALIAGCYLLTVRVDLSLSFAEDLLLFVAQHVQIEAHKLSLRASTAAQAPGCCLEFAATRARHWRWWWRWSAQLHIEAHYGLFWVKRDQSSASEPSLYIARVNAALRAATKHGRNSVFAM